ncbi:L,D-transpeptidase family protein [Salmonella enterica]|nr:L,D-transpeptidase family protein [Salmonella enterica]
MQPELSIKDSHQLLMVRSPSPESTSASLMLYEKNTAGKWVEVGSRIPVKLGKRGLRWDSQQVAVYSLTDTKKEGDKASPAGVFPLLSTMSYERDIHSKMPHYLLTDNIKCVDDENSRFYNQIVDDRAKENDWSSSETMKRKDDLYKYVIVVGYNPQHHKGKGSCIFMHVWRNSDSPTAGCTAMPEADVKWLIEQLNPTQKPLLVQLTDQDYQKLHLRWMLP